MGLLAFAALLLLLLLWLLSLLLLLLLFSTGWCGAQGQTSPSTGSPLWTSTATCWCSGAWTSRPGTCRLWPSGKRCVGTPPWLNVPSILVSSGGLPLGWMDDDAVGSHRSPGLTCICDDAGRQNKRGWVDGWVTGLGHCEGHAVQPPVPFPLGARHGRLRRRRQVRVPRGTGQRAASVVNAALRSSSRAVRARARSPVVLAAWWSWLCRESWKPYVRSSKQEKKELLRRQRPRRPRPPPPHTSIRISRLRCL